MGVGLSYVSGDSRVPLRYQTIGSALDEAAERWGSREALVVPHQGVRWNWAELRDRSRALAAGLLALGLEPGDRVGIWSPNRAEWVLTQFATACAGLVLVNINPAYRLAELEYALNKVACRALVLADRFKSSDYLQMLRELAPEIDGAVPGQLVAARLPALAHAIVIADREPAGFHRFADIPEHATDASRHRLRELGDALQAEDPINIQFTSGTTGAPKGATLSHHNILNNGFFVGEAQGFTEEDRLCIPVPLYHCFGMVMGVLNCVTHGATMVFPGEAFEPASVLGAVERERCTALYGVPTMFIAELDHAEFDRFDLSSLRTGVMAGSPCPVEVMKRVIERMHMQDVTIAYGMTETSPVSFQTHPDDPLDKKVGSVGRIHPHLEVKLVDEAGKVVALGERGELCTRGYSVMCGYWNDAERTGEAVDAAGWMHTGDLAVLDERGYCSIVGRVKDMILRGGENIYPREIEEYIYRHEEVQDVAVFGVPDDRYGEAVAAWICLKPGASVTEKEILDFCRGQIAHYKIPTYIRFVDDFPMTVTGKIQKFVMREEMTAILHLEESSTA